MRLNGKAILGIVISVVLLWWVFRNESPAAILHEIRSADPWLFGLSILVATLGVVPRAIRWGILLRPVSRRVAFYPRLTATTIGIAANNLLPARVGEFARAFSLSRLTRVPTAAAFGSLVIERVLDALVLLALLFGVMAHPDFPLVTQLAGVSLRAAAAFTVLLLGALGVVLLLLVLMPTRAAALVEGFARRLLPAGLRRPVVDAMRSFLTGIAVLRDVRLLLLSLAWALVQWLFIALSFLFGFWAFGIDEPGFVGALFLQSLIGVAVALPSSPGFFGPFEAAAKLGLSLWNVAPETAVSFAIGYHVGSFVPITLLGIYFVWRLGLSWREVERSEEVVEERIERDVGLGEPAPGVDRGA